MPTMTMVGVSTLPTNEMRRISIGFKVLPGLAGNAVVGITVVVVRRQSLADPVHDGFHNRSGSEAMVLSDDPCSHDSTRTAAGDVEMVFVNVACHDQLIDPVHNILVVITWVVVVKQVAESFPIPGAASEVG